MVGSGTRTHWNSYIQEWPLQVLSPNTVTFTGCLSVCKGARNGYLLACNLLPFSSNKFMASSCPVHSSRDQSCAEVAQVGFAGVVKISRCEDTEFRSIAGLQAFPRSVVSWLNASPLPVKSWPWSSKEDLYWFLWPACLMRAQGLRQEKTQSPDTPSAWQAVKQERFECDPLSIMGKL